MGKRTGKPRGRPRGAKNKHTRDREEQIEQTATEIAEALGLNGFDGDAHALLMLVYKNASIPMDLRLDAAKAAIGYEKPKLSSVDAKVDGVIGQYAAQPIPVEQRDSDSVAGSSGPAANGHSPGHG
jgi:hypothetical protein